MQPYCGEQTQAPPTPRFPLQLKPGVILEAGTEARAGIATQRQLQYWLLSICSPSAYLFSHYLWRGPETCTCSVKVYLTKLKITWRKGFFEEAEDKSDNIPYLFYAARARRLHVFNLASTFQGAV